jgi:hypothetical protein
MHAKTRLTCLLQGCVQTNLQCRGAKSQNRGLGKPCTDGQTYIQASVAGRTAWSNTWRRGENLMILLVAYVQLAVQKQTARARIASTHTQGGGGTEREKLNS